MATRTRERTDESFRQSRFGERSEAGQTPAGMFLETVTQRSSADGSLPRVQIIRRNPRTGKLKAGDPCKTKEDILRQVLLHTDGHLTAFEADDYSARLITLDPGPEGADARRAWVEILYRDSDACAHPELTDPELCDDHRLYSIR